MAYFISEGELKILTTLSTNVDSHLIAPYFKQSEDLYIRPLLGIPLFDTLKAKIANNTLDVIETKLIEDWLKPCCAHFLLYQVFPFIHEKIMNKGIVNKTSEQSTPVAETTIRALRAEIQNTADFYKKGVYDYIVANKDNFPDFYDVECNSRLEPISAISFDAPKVRFETRQKWDDFYG